MRAASRNIPTTHRVNSPSAMAHRSRARDDSQYEFTPRLQASGLCADKRRNRFGNVQTEANRWEILSIIKHVRLEADNLKQRFCPSQHPLDNTPYTIKMSRSFISFSEGNWMNWKYIYITLWISCWFGGKDKIRNSQCSIVTKITWKAANWRCLIKEFKNDYCIRTYRMTWNLIAFK